MYEKHISFVFYSLFCLSSDSWRYLDAVSNYQLKSRWEIYWFGEFTSIDLILQWNSSWFFILSLYGAIH